MSSTLTIRTAVCLVLGAVAGSGAAPPPALDLEKFFRESVGLTAEQVAAVRGGRAVAIALKSRIPAEIFVFGAVHVAATPEAYVRLARDIERLRKMPGYLAIGGIGSPPRLEDFRDFAFDDEEIRALRRCQPADCDVQMPASSIAALHAAVDWSAPDLADRINRRLREKAVEELSAYQREGNRVLGVYNDKRDPTEVPKQFAFLLGYSKALPEYLPELHRYLLEYPDGRPANLEDLFYWSRVKFGLKPTLRVVHVVTLRGAEADPVVYAIAEKQLYSSHYFQTALDLAFCVRDTEDPQRPGFFLIKAMGSVQAGLTGFKGAIVRKVAVDRSVGSLQKSLAAVKAILEETRRE
jgi:hypothetical protein